MRSEQEMLDLILDTARHDERIRAVIMNGSRANPNAPRDPFQDFDIQYLVSDVASFVDDRHWIDRFGELMILQLPDTMSDSPPAGHRGFTYLMQFADGNRIDLCLFPVDKIAELEEDSLSLLLLDKDGLLKPFPPASDRSYLPRLPTAKLFADCCNEFWWVCPYVAKGLWRQEIPYAKGMLEIDRDQLIAMLGWYVGVTTGFTRNPGKMGKYLQRCLEPELWAMVEQTYADAGYEQTWDALLAMGDLFRIAAGRVATHFGYKYPQGDDDRVSAHLRHVRHLPRTATEIY